ncbi:MAG: phosphate ABC transporter permease subunit PstC [Lachnospiraceae bacterium]|nr:phosphate ABC transporter permease subunit PstC [Lachnospiraceae bacterium]
MRRIKERIVYVLLGGLTIITLLALGFVMVFIIKEALPLFREVSLREFLFTTKWMPVSGIGLKMHFGIGNFIASTIYVSVLAMIIATVVSVGAAIYLGCVSTEQQRGLWYPFIDLLAGIPSVIYGFVGLTVLVKLFLKAGVKSGSCILAASIVLAVMLFPYMISSCSETLRKNTEQYLPVGSAMGIDSWYTISSVILPASLKSIVISMILAIGRAMGETMAVMMVAGNANLFPKLFGKGETVASVIALEMGTAVNGSTHFHALYGAGLVLMVLLLAIRLIMNAIAKRLL